MTLSGAEVTLALAAAPAADAAVTVGYAPTAAGAARLRDAAGNEVEGFAEEAAANETAPPAVTGVEVTSDPGPDGVYAEGETIEATVRFSAAVRVPLDGGAVEGATLTVPPTLALIADTAAGDATLRRAVYASGSGTAALSFSWPVSKGDGSLRAVRVAASGLKPGSGAIVSAATGAPALLGFGEAPGVTAVSVVDETDGRWGRGRHGRGDAPLRRAGGGRGRAFGRAGARGVPGAGRRICGARSAMRSPSATR